MTSTMYFSLTASLGNWLYGHRPSSARQRQEHRAASQRTAIRKGLGNFKAGTRISGRARPGTRFTIGHDAQTAGVPHRGCRSCRARKLPQTPGLEQSQRREPCAITRRWCGWTPPIRRATKPARWSICAACWKREGIPVTVAAKEPGAREPDRAPEGQRLEAAGDHHGPHRYGQRRPLQVDLRALQRDARRRLRLRPRHAGRQERSDRRVHDHAAAEALRRCRSIAT